VIDLDTAIHSITRQIEGLQAQIMECRTKLEKLQEARRIAIDVSGETIGPVSKDIIEDEPFFSQSGITQKDAAIEVVKKNGMGNWLEVRDVVRIMLETGWEPKSNNFATAISTALSRAATEGLILQRKLGMTKEFKALD
jgi:hypothetical protein